MKHLSVNVCYDNIFNVILSHQNRGETIMLYTYQRRRALNKVVRDMYPEVNFYENTSGVPVMECNNLPQGFKQVTEAESFIQRIIRHCSKPGCKDTYIPDYSKTFPVFIESMQLTGEGSKKVEKFYRVNFVSVSEKSLEKAGELIAEGKLYAAMPTKESNP